MLVNSGGVPWVISVWMFRVLIRFLVSMTAEVKVRASPMTFRLCEIASEMRMRYCKALVGQQQRNEHQGE
ncbi:MAG: hypothetical protein H6822_24370 [Planctomycetaceae bacterium]|nr:hypothetical protein [Planctomycetales bacterium]MCB9925336.1 hypothetical protein [Planctomycetaceae bacterium]